MVGLPGLGFLCGFYVVLGGCFGGYLRFILLKALLVLVGRVGWIDGSLFSKTLNLRILEAFQWWFLFFAGV